MNHFEHKYVVKNIYISYMPIWMSMWQKTKILNHTVLRWKVIDLYINLALAYAHV